MGDLCVSEARGVIFEGNLVFPLIDAEFAQAVGVGEFSEALELLKAQRRLKFVGNFEECHGGIIAAAASLSTLRRGAAVAGGQHDPDTSGRLVSLDADRDQGYI